MNLYDGGKMNVDFKERDFTALKADALVLVLTKEDVAAGSKVKKPGRLVAAFRGDESQLLAALSGSNFSGDKGEQVAVYGLGKYKVVFLVGAGDESELTGERLRRAASAGVRAAQSGRFESVVMATLDSLLEKMSHYEVVHSLLEGGILGAYKFDKYFTLNGKNHKLRSITIAFSRVDASIGRKAARDAQLVCEAVYLTRDLCNAPANEVYPEVLAEVATKMARKYHVRARILDERQIRKLRMGGLLAVNSGSARPPRFITLEYKGNPRSRDWYVIVGKGITFDSGGISLKPAAGMGEMKMDMSGAAAVIGTIQALASLKIPVNVAGLAPSTENLPGGKAYKPGDVVKTMSGITIEVDNTDAEGRIILSDALHYAKRYNPKAIIDMATLTGACVVALGHHATGMLGTGDEVMSLLKEAGEKTFERVWQLPVYEEYEKQIKSDIADVKNVGGRWAGTITAALFLKKFVGDYPWVHLDIAGTAMLEEQGEYSARGGSGVGVRLLTQFFKQIASQR